MLPGKSTLVLIGLKPAMSPPLPDRVRFGARERRVGKSSHGHRDKLGKSLHLSNKQSSRKSGRIGMSLNGPVWRRYGQGGQRSEPPPERFGHDRPVRLRITPVNTEPPITYARCPHAVLTCINCTSGLGTMPSVAFRLRSQNFTNVKHHKRGIVPRTCTTCTSATYIPLVERASASRPNRGYAALHLPLPKNRIPRSGLFCRRCFGGPPRL